MEDSAFFHFDYSLDGFDFQCFSSDQDYCPKSSDNNTGSYIEACDAVVERPAKQLKTNSWNSCTTDQHITPKASPASSQIISFDNSISSPAISQQVFGPNCSVNPKIEAAGYHGNINSSSFICKGSYEDKFCSTKYVPDPKRGSSVTRSTRHAQDHVIAERKRREKLNQRFIALSALLPGLKKVQL